MKKIVVAILVVAFIIIVSSKTSNPEVDFTPEISTAYTNEQAVKIKGYTETAMEPFIARDGTVLFFNSLNDGKTTSVFYATRIDDTTFQFAGEVKGVNGEVPHLDAVASLDTDNNFYWVSLRNYPETMENLQTGTWKNGQVENIRPVLGDFYNRTPGWIIMDAEITPDGQQLYYVTADFRQGGAVPSGANIGIANKDGDYFKKVNESESILASINRLGIVYAPSISTDGLKLLFTRLIPGTGTELYLADRTSTNLPFAEPKLLATQGDLSEAGSFTADTNTIYFHQKTKAGYGLFTLTASPQ